MILGVKGRRERGVLSEVNGREREQLWDSASGTEKADQLRTSSLPTTKRAFLTITTISIVDVLIIQVPGQVN
jgi:hypothetical protein